MACRPSFPHSGPSVPKPATSPCATCVRVNRSRGLFLMSRALDGYSAATLLTAPKHAPLTVELSAHGRSVRLAKRPGESAHHLLLKGLLWACALPLHPEAQCELELGLRYRPDVVALGADGVTPCWWGECGSVKPSKLASLASTFPQAHIAVAKWGRSDLRGYASQLRGELALPRTRTAPFSLVSFPDDSLDRFLTDEGELRVSFDDLDIVELV